MLGLDTGDCQQWTKLTRTVPSGELCIVLPALCLCSFLVLVWAHRSDPTKPLFCLQAGYLFNFCFLFYGKSYQWPFVVSLWKLVISTSHMYTDTDIHIHMLTQTDMQMQTHTHILSLSSPPLVCSISLLFPMHREEKTQVPDPCVSPEVAWLSSSCPLKEYGIQYSKKLHRFKSETAFRMFTWCWATPNVTIRA